MYIKGWGFENHWSTWETFFLIFCSDVAFSGRTICLFVCFVIILFKIRTMNHLSRLFGWIALFSVNQLAIQSVCTGLFRALFRERKHQWMKLIAIHLQSVEAPVETILSINKVFVTFNLNVGLVNDSVETREVKIWIWLKEYQYTKTLQQLVWTFTLTYHLNINYMVSKIIWLKRCLLTTSISPN